MVECENGVAIVARGRASTSVGLITSLMFHFAAVRGVTGGYYFIKDLTVHLKIPASISLCIYG